MVLLSPVLDIFHALLIRVGVGKGELHARDEFVKHKVELEHELLFLVQSQPQDRVGQTIPISNFLVLVTDTVDRAVELVTLGLGGGRFTMAKRKWTRCTEKVTLRLENPPTRK